MSPFPNRWNLPPLHICLPRISFHRLCNLVGPFSTSILFWIPSPPFFRSNPSRCSLYTLHLLSTVSRPCCSGEATTDDDRFTVFTKSTRKSIPKFLFTKPTRKSIPKFLTTCFTVFHPSFRHLFPPLNFICCHFQIKRASEEDRLKDFPHWPLCFNHRIPGLCRLIGLTYARWLNLEILKVSKIFPYFFICFIRRFQRFWRGLNAGFHR